MYQIRYTETQVYQILNTIIIKKRVRGIQLGYFEGRGSAAKVGSKDMNGGSEALFL